MIYLLKNILADPITRSLSEYINDQIRTIMKIDYTNSQIKQMVNTAISYVDISIDMKLNAIIVITSKQFINHNIFCIESLNSLPQNDKLESSVFTHAMGKIRDISTDSVISLININENILIANEIGRAHV